MNTKCDFMATESRDAWVCRVCGRRARGTSSPPRAMCPLPSPATAPKKPLALAPHGPRGPGAQLKQTLSECGIEPKAGCRCEDLAAQMDAWGAAGCREHFADIVSRLRQDSAQYNWREKLTAASTCWRLLGGIGRLVSAAIAAAEDLDRPRELRTFHLLYHLWPVAASEMWRWNLDQLFQNNRLDQFNGRRVVAVSLDDRTVPIAEVRAAFRGQDVELVEQPNDARLREAASFVALLSRVKSRDPSQATFYAHAKGVSRRGKVLLEVIRAWSECMYRENLDDPQRVRSALATHAMLGVRFGCETRWRYPGTFFWFRQSDVFRTGRWRRIDNPISDEGPGWAIEAFPERMFSPGACAAIRVDLPAPPGTHRSLYAPEVWGLGCPETLDAALARFDEQGYLEMYPDIAASVAAGDWPSGRDHFIRFGFAERRPI